MSGSLVKRTLTGCVLVTATAAAVYSGSFYVAALFWVVMNIGLHEWASLAGRLGGKISIPWLFAWGNLLYGFVTGKICADAGLLEPRMASILGICCALCLVAMVVSSVFSVRKGVLHTAMILAGGLYVSGSLAFLTALILPFGELGADVLMGFFLLIWAGDVFAYVTGSLLGKHKLCERLSPSKTWEGAIGGFCLAMLAGFLWWYLRLPEIPVTLWLGMSVVVSLAGICGDLVESKLKREAGVKDSGTFLPGHGGILDRFDSVFLACPLAVVFWYAVSLF